MIEDTPEPSTAEHAPKSARHTSSSAFRLWQIPSSQRDTIVHGLMKMITYMSEPIQRSQSLLRQAMLLLRGFLAPDIFRDANIRLGTFAALRADVTSSNLHLFVNSAEILCIVIEHESDEWVATHLPIIQQFLEKGMSSSFDAAHQALTPALIRIFALLRDVPTPAPVAIAQDPEAPAASTGGTGTTQGDTVMAADAPETPEKQFLSWAVTHVEKSLSSQQNSLGTVALLVAMSKCRPDRIDVFLTQILRLLNRVVKEHLSGQVPQENAETSRQLIESCIHLLSLRVAHLGEQWRWLLNSLLQLADRSPSIPLCRFLLGLLSGWVFETSETAAPSVKDKGAILLKMCSFENRGDSSLLHDFLQLILRIYREPAFQRSELTFKLENAFLLGCRSRDAQLRTSFLDIFNDAVSRTLFTRLHYILGVQNWEALADNWLHQAIDLLLGCASTDVVLFEPSEAVLGDQRQRPFAIELSALRSGKLLQATRRLLYADPHVTQEMWNATFKAAWSCLEPAERETITDLSIDLLSKDHNNRMVDRSPNPIQGIVSGLQACSPTPPLPPHLVRHLARVYNVWYPVIELLQDSIENHREESPAIQDSALDALAELYSDLGEEDFYYGLWRRRGSPSSISL